MSLPLLGACFTAQASQEAGAVQALAWVRQHTGFIGHCSPVCRRACNGICDEFAMR